jgi:CRISPR-associated protein Csm3
MQIPTFQANFILRGKIECLTGLHIGGSKEKLQIGGVDSIVIRNPRNQHPYIPGSSLKGKIRHLLEYITGGVNKPIHREAPSGKSIEELDRINLGQVSRKEEIARIFGVGVDDRDKHDELKHIGLPRLIVRDAYPDAATIEMWGNLGSDANFTEYKAENTIDRLTSAANPRFIERVVEGSVFDFEIVYTAYAESNSEEEIKTINSDIGDILLGLRLLENNALGKSGSRGYGRIKFWLDEPHWVYAQDYRGATHQWEQSRQPLPGKAQLNPLGGFTAMYHYKAPVHEG